jgi:hypothetical protein
MAEAQARTAVNRMPAENALASTASGIAKMVTSVANQTLGAAQTTTKTGIDYATKVKQGLDPIVKSLTAIADAAANLLTLPAAVSPKGTFIRDAYDNLASAAARGVEYTYDQSTSMDKRLAEVRNRIGLPVDKSLTRIRMGELDVEEKPTAKPKSKPKKKKKKSSGVQSYGSNRRVRKANIRTD